MLIEIVAGISVVALLGHLKNKFSKPLSPDQIARAEEVAALCAHIDGLSHEHYTVTRQRRKDQLYKSVNTFEGYREWFLTDDGINFLQRTPGLLQSFENDQNELEQILRTEMAELDAREAARQQAEENQRLEYIEKYRKLLTRAKTSRDVALVESHLRELGA